MATITNQDKSGTGSLFGNIMAQVTLAEDRKYDYEFVSMLGCLDAPQFVPNGSTVAFESLGKLYATSSTHSRDAA